MHRSSRAALLAAAITALWTPPPVAGQAPPTLAPGKLLVAREDMRDPNFERTVVLIVAYEESGAMGVVLNRPSPLRIDHVLPHLELPADSAARVHFGGPVAVQQATIVFSSDQPEGRTHVFGNVHVSGDLVLLERLATQPRPGERYRVFAGHAGWAPGQLDAEVSRRGWHVLPATEAVVFDDSTDLWEVLIRRTRTRLAEGRRTRTPGAR